MTMYWVSIISMDIQGRPKMVALTDALLSYEDALAEIKFQRENHKVLSAWVDTFDEQNKKSTVYQTYGQPGNLRAIKGRHEFYDFNF